MKKTTGLCALLLTAFTAQAADLYMWKDANGVTHYSGTPPQGTKYETRRIDSRSGVAPVDEEVTSAETPQCTSARENLKILAASAPVGQDTDGDGQADTTLNDEQRTAQKNLAEAAVKAYCPVAPVG